MKVKSVFSEVFFYSVGLLFLLGFFFMLWFVVTKEIPANNKDVVLMLIGVLSNGVALILGYFYGSSKGSAEKTAIMSEQKATADNAAIIASLNENPATETH